MYLSSMSKPHGKDLKPSSATTRQVAIILWVTFSWYFHEPEPNFHVLTPESAVIPEIGRIKKEWCLSVEQKGILGHRNKMFKLERLGLLACEDASVGTDKDSNNICDMFISQRAFWQLDPRLYLSSLTTSELPSSSAHVGSIIYGCSRGRLPFRSGSQNIRHASSFVLSFSTTAIYLHGESSPSNTTQKRQARGGILRQTHSKWRPIFDFPFTSAAKH